MINLLSAGSGSQNLFQQLIDAAIPIGKYQLHWLELLGVLIGIASAWYGMKRRVWAWPVGIVAN
ncbi:MAG TPA: nicotinamide mononucleotide transporter, partial [Pedococcus sp.]|nr:nicotinamide mononucleotide transporter [Pedococcus sp.]